MEWALQLGWWTSEDMQRNGGGNLSENVHLKDKK